MTDNFFRPVRHVPLAKFFYQGSHTHPVRRTVLVIESTSRLITGYELREGNNVRPLSEAPIKSYRRQRIAKDRQVNHRRHSGSEVSTLKRADLLEVLKSGV